MVTKASVAAKELAFVEKCIIKTTRKFRENPQTFWSNEDVCCYLKGLLLKGRPLKSGQLGNVRLGYNTKNTYKRCGDGSLAISSEGESERFALVGWSSATPTARDHLTQQLSFAVEPTYFRSVPADWMTQVRNSLVKLNDEANQIPMNGRFFLFLSTQPSSQFGERLSSIFAEFPLVRCYQQPAQ